MNRTGSSNRLASNPLLWRLGHFFRRRAAAVGVIGPLSLALLLSPVPSGAQSLAPDPSGASAPAAGVLNPQLQQNGLQQGAMLSQDNAPKAGFFSKRRSLGAVFIASGVVLAMQGFDFKDEADGFYDAYESATDPAEIEKFYQRTTNRDVKSQVTWALAAAFGVTGLRLVLTGGSSAAETTPSRVMAQPSVTIQQPLIALVPTVTARTVGLQLQRHFH